MIKGEAVRQLVELGYSVVEVSELFGASAHSPYKCVKAVKPDKTDEQTAAERKVQQAINLANRLTDVVTVDDHFNRTLDVRDNVSTAYQGLRVRDQNLVKALPLLMVGFLLFGLVAWFDAWLSNRKKLWQRLTPNPFAAELLAQTIKVIFIILGLILALSLIGAETIIDTLLGGAGVIGIAIGLP